MALRDTQDVLITEISGSPSGHLRDTQDVLIFELPILVGSFQDVFGNPIAYGYLILELNQDGVGGGVGQTTAGRKIRIPLDANGTVSSAYTVALNSAISPAGTTYAVWAYNAAGQLVWGPNYNLVVAGTLKETVAVWVPNVNA